MSSNKKTWKDWLPHRPFKPSETIRDWDPLNIKWDDETVCVLCGKKEPCECFDEYYCSCGLKNRNCKWPESIECKCKSCGKIWVECLCDKPNKFDDEQWLEIKAFKYNMQYDWSKETEKFTNKELERLDEEDE